MKTPKYLKIVAISISCTLICILAFAGGGKGNNAGNGSTGGGSSKPKCSDVYTGTTSLTLSSINLTYDLSDYMPDLMSDIMELQQAHWEISTMSDGKGSIRQLETIIQSAGQYPEDRKPVCKADFSSETCTGTISHTFTLDDIAGTTIKNIPDFGVSLNKTILNIRTIKTSIWNLQLIWDATINIQNIANIRWDDDAKIECEWKGIPKLRPVIMDSTFLVREVDPGIYTILENINQDNVLILEIDETTRIDILEDTLKFSPILKQPVYSGGKYTAEVVWKQPYAAKLSDNDN